MYFAYLMDKNMNRLFFLFVAIIGVIFFVGCRSTRELMVDYEQNLVTGYFGKAGEISSDQANKENSSQLMWRLLAGNALLLDNQPAQAIEQLDLAEDIFAENDTQSVFSRGLTNTKAMLYNDNSFDYNGLGQDRIFCCLYKGMEYVFMGNAAAARTEFNRASDHQENWLFERRKDIQAAEERLAAEAESIPADRRVQGQDTKKQTSAILQDASFCDQIRTKCGYDPVNSGNLDRLPRAAYLNAYLAHFVGIFRWLNGDGARGYLRDARDLCVGNSVVAEDLAAVEASNHPQNTVWIYVEDGLCAKREEWRLDIPAFLIPYANRYVLYAGMALPYLVKRDVGADAYYVGEEGMPLAQIPELQDVDKLLKTEYDVYMSGALPREITRALLRIGGQVALGIAIDKADDETTRFALQLTQVGLAAYDASVTEADLRSWISLPKSVKMHRIKRPADGKIVVVATNPGARHEMHLELPEGNSIVWIRKVSRGTGMVAKVATFP